MPKNNLIALGDLGFIREFAVFSEVSRQEPTDQNFQ
jgi:hypothetical protein